MIIAIAWITFVFVLLQFLVALANIIWYEQMKGMSTDRSEKVSVLIPARNEEANIATIIKDVLAQDHEQIELIVFDDQSEDSTAAIVGSYAEKDRRVKLIRSTSLPEGWMGKNHACHTLAGQASGRYFLFLDADVRISGDIIGQSIAHASKHDLGLISIFPEQLMPGIGERMSVPIMNYILLTLLPLILVRASGRPSLAAANGQFMFFEAETYRRLQPHQTMRTNRVEDIAIARYYKEKGETISCQTGDDRIRCRMYKNYAEAFNGFSKNVIDFFGGSAFFAILFWLITSLGMILVIIGMSPLMILAFFVIYLSGRILVSLRSKQNVCMNLIFLLPQQISMGVFILNALLHYRGKKLEWKGRKV
ncbi:MAG: glycosyltransferase family 2 protein [Bacteroidales bacterium]|nr:glycosyltransferase family 2 protein [Bacteroidales bacterium]